MEAPLEIRLGYGPLSRRKQMVLAITMRTPGADAALAAGFLLGEGLVVTAGDIQSAGPCGAPGESVRIELAPAVRFDPERLSRHLYVSSSCGVCGKTAIEAVLLAGAEDLCDVPFRMDTTKLTRLPRALAARQAAFRATGGLHAAALFDARGAIVDLAEDVGRHNAVDKLLGAALLGERLPLHDRGLLLSGRASFELLQKAAMARIPLVAAIGAPSSLAVEVAETFGITLVGFLKAAGGNVYSHRQRLEST